jgi:hypothetical protein
MQQQQQVLRQMLMPGSAATSMSSLGDADLRQLWQAVTRVEPGATGSQVCAWPLVPHIYLVFCSCLY